VVAFLGKLKKESEALHAEVAEIVVHSEGAFSWNEIWFMCYSERDLACKTISNFNLKRNGQGGKEFL